MRKDKQIKQAYSRRWAGIACRAIYLVDDAGFKGEHIHIIEALPIIGGSNDGSGPHKEVSSVAAAGC